MAFQTYTQDPADVLDYPFDWQGGDKPFLAPGITIATSTFAAYDLTWATTTDITLSDDDHDDTTTQVRVSTADATPGAAYYVTNHVVGSDGQEKDWTIKIKIKEQ